ncbi:MAG: exo-alpha-sialidase, partial [Thermoguttaceae bacterium]|nr:exo-alpha-sialidase [Thermoguttaceae bacterium]
TEICDSTTDCAQFQLTSTDYGKTWRRERTNITDVSISTPSLLYDAERDLLTAYYYHRGAGLVQRRVVNPNDVWDAPTRWSDPTTVAVGSAQAHHAGNNNATQIGDVHYIAFYSGDEKNTSVLTVAIPAPTSK